MKLNVQLMNGDQPAIGPRKALILEAIDREGAISAAGRALEMSYRRIWLLVDSLNTSWRERIVDARVGGGKTGGPELIPFGRELLTTYRAVEGRMMSASSGTDLDWLLSVRATPE